MMGIKHDHRVGKLRKDIAKRIKFNIKILPLSIIVVNTV